MPGNEVRAFQTVLITPPVLLVALIPIGLFCLTAFTALLAALASLCVLLDALISIGKFCLTAFTPALAEADGFPVKSVALIPIGLNCVGEFTLALADLRKLLQCYPLLLISIGLVCICRI